jgi:hypothetical protein
VTVTTYKPHNFAIGNSVTIAGASPYHEVKTRSIDYYPQTTNATISSIARSASTVTVTTANPHGLVQYETVTISGTGNTFLNGDFTAASISSPTVFTYTTGTSGTIASITVGKVEKHPIASLTALDEHHLQPGDTIDVKNVGESIPISSAQYESGGNQTGKAVATSSQTKNRVTLVMSTNHGFEVDNYITVSGSSRSTFNGTFKVASVSHSSPFSVGYDIATSTTIASGADTGATIKTKQRAIVTTSIGHNLKSGQALTFSDMTESYVVTRCAMSLGTATLTMSTNHNVVAGDSIVVSDIYENITSTQKRIIEGVVTLTVPSTSGLKVNDSISVSGLTEQYDVSHAERTKNKVTIYISGAHNIKEGDTINVNSIADVFEGAKGERSEKTVTSVVGNKVSYNFASATSAAIKKVTVKKTATKNATVTKVDSDLYNGDKTISEISATSISYVAGNADVINNIPISSQTGTVRFDSPLNGTYPVDSTPLSTKLTYVIPGSAISFSEKDALKSGDNEDAKTPTVSGPSPLQKLTNPVVDAIISNTQFSVDMSGETINSRGNSKVYNGFVSSDVSVFNGSRKVVSVPTDDPKTLSFSASIDLNGISVREQAVNNYAYFRATDLFNGSSKTITAVATGDNALTYSKAHSDVPAYTIAGKGTATVRPVAITSTYGGFPGNANINIQFSTGLYSGVNVKPTLYRGFELASVGEALDKYSDSIDGFEYRIDCEFDETTQTFTKTFVLIPINFPDPPAVGELSPLSRFGADEFVFEYPGNIANVSINESAENSSTRFFALGTNDAGADVGANYSAASDTQLLTVDSFGRKWPLLDDDEKIDNTDDKAVLYTYANKYMTEARPPDAQITISVNGSLEPKVGTYSPGDWCAIVVDDQFVRARLQTDLEPRDNVLVRKIESYSVSVPDSVTFPEKVTLRVIPEWEVDKRG